MTYFYKLSLALSVGLYLAGCSSNESNFSGNQGKPKKPPKALNKGENLVGTERASANGSPDISFIINGVDSKSGDPVGVYKGDALDIAYEAKNFDDCTLLPLKKHGVKQSIKGYEVAGNTEFSLTCTKKAEPSAVEKIQVVILAQEDGPSGDVVAEGPRKDVPSVELKVNHQSDDLDVAKGAKLVVSWQARYVDRCELEAVEKESVGIDGTKELELVSASLDIGITCYAGVNPVFKGIKVRAKAVSELLADLLVDGVIAPEVMVDPGSSATLSWKATSDAKSCELKEKGQKDLLKQGVSGELVITPKSPTTYELTCVTPFGDFTKSETTINIAGETPRPVISVSVDGDKSSEVSVAYGSSPTVVWEVSQATSCQITPFESQEIQGQEVLSTLKNDQVLTFLCKNQEQEASKKVTIKVAKEPAPTITLRANETQDTLTIGYQKKVVLSWKAEHAVSCIDPEEQNTLEGKWEFDAAAPKNYTMSCLNESGVETKATLALMITDMPVSETFTGASIESFTPVDVIIAFDTSGSMNNEMAAMKANIVAFIKGFMNHPVLKTVKDGVKIHLIGNYTLPSDLLTSPDLASFLVQYRCKPTYSCANDFVTVGSTDALSVLQMILSHQQTPVRANSLKEILVITDDNANSTSVAPFVTLIDQDSRYKSLTTLNGILALTEQTAASCDIARKGAIYLDQAKIPFRAPLDKGFYDICTTDWADLLVEKFGQNVIKKSLSSRFTLKSKIDLDKPVSVTKNGVTLPKEAYRFDTEANAIIFNTGFEPQPSVDQVVVTYQVKPAAT